MIAFNARSKYPKVSRPISDISSIIKTFKYQYCFSTYEEFHHLTFFYSYDFNPNLTGRRNAACNVIPLIPVAVCPVDAVTRRDVWSRFWFRYLRTRFKYSVIALVKKLFPMPASPLKNIWNDLDGNSLFFSVNLLYEIEQMLLTFIQLRTYFIKLFIRKW